MECQSIRTLVGPRRCGRVVVLGTLALALLVSLPPLCCRADQMFPEGWVSLDGVTTSPAPPSSQIISSSAGEMIIWVRTPGVLSALVDHEGTEYTELSIPEYAHTHETGHPRLPAIRQLVAVPRGCTVELTSAILDSVDYSGSLVSPVPTEVTRYTSQGWEYLDHEFALDGDAYATAGFYPSRAAEVEYAGIMRGQAVALVTVYPLRHDPVAMDTRAYPSVVVTLGFSGGGAGAPASLGPFERIAESLILGYAGSVQTTRRGPADPGTVQVCSGVQECAGIDADYLMIVEGSLMGSEYITDLANHRANYNGYNVAIVSDQTVAQNPPHTIISDVAIRDFISDVYGDTWAEHMRWYGLIRSESKILECFLQVRKEQDENL